MIRWIGAGLILLACGRLGLLKALELKKHVRCFRAGTAVAMRMDFLINRRCAPMPEVLEDLKESFPELFGKLPGPAQLGDMPFRSVWKTWLDAAGFSGKSGELLSRFGESAAQGEDTVKAAENCIAEMLLCRNAAEREEKEKGKIYTVLGMAAGCMLTLILL